MGAARRKIKAYKEDIAMGSVIPANALKGTAPESRQFKILGPGVTIVWYAFA